MPSKHYLLTSNVPLQVHWSERIHSLIREYTERCASHAGVDASKYEDDNLKAVEEWMTKVVRLIKPLIKLVKEDTGQLPTAGDVLSLAPGYSATIDKRNFYCPPNEPGTYGVGYFLETDTLNFLAEIKAADNLNKQMS